MAQERSRRGPIRYFAASAFAALAVCGRAQDAPQSKREKPEVFYTVTVSDDSRVPLRVAMTVQAAPNETVAVAIPAWSPGFYQIAHYEKNISNMTATDANHKSLPLRHSDPRVWKTERPVNSGSVKFEYEVRPDDKGLGFFGTALYPNGGGYINGASAFLYYVGHTDSPAHLTLETKGAKQAATALTSFGSNVGKTSAFLYHAESYDELIDSPIQFGKFKTIDFRVGETPFRIVGVGDWRYDKTKTVDALTKIAKAEAAVFGSFPFQSYLFDFHVGGVGFEGGLEHRNSTVIHLSKSVSGTPDDDFITIAAHEFFHAWNVKRIRPAALTPLDYSKEARTGSLWFAEGVTDYYSYLLPFRAGLRSPEWFLKQLQNDLDDLEKTPTRRGISLESASRKTWEGQSEGFDELSYYVKGCLVGFYFDLRIRELTKSAVSLDDVMRELDKTYGARNVGYPEDAILTAINKVAQADLTDEYNRYVKGTDEIDWDSVLPDAGIRLQRSKSAALGVATEGSRDAATEFAPVIKRIYAGMAGEKLGLKLGDMVQNVNGVAITQSNFAGSIKNLKPGDALTMDVLRDGKIVSLRGEIGYAWKIGGLTLAPDNPLTPLVAQVRSAYFTQEAR